MQASTKVRMRETKTDRTRTQEARREAIYRRQVRAWKAGKS